jgi:hypothetical protein
VVNKKSAPQHDILEIKRVGEWGKLEYHHRLTCGHVEVRKRPSKAPRIACAWCVVASEKQRELKALTIVQPPVVEEVWDFYDDTVVDEVMVANLRSGVANALGCPQENIEVVATVDDDGNLRVNYVSVFLDYPQAQKLASSSTKIVDIPTV